MSDTFLYEPGTQKGEVAKEFIRLTREVVALRVKLEDFAKLEQFFREVMGVTFQGCDWDGDELQDKAEALGLAHYEPYDPAKHDSHGCDIDLGEPVLVLSIVGGVKSR